MKFDAFVEEHRTTHINIDARLDRIEGDTGALKGDFARTRTVQDARNIAYDMGLEFVRALGSEELREMAGNTLPRDVGRSFQNAALAIEATEATDTRYIAMEVSFTADLRDCNRAIWNAELIESFTGKPAQPAIASVRNDRAAAETVESRRCTGTRWRTGHRVRSSSEEISHGRPRIQFPTQGPPQCHARGSGGDERDDRTRRNRQHQLSDTALAANHATPNIQVNQGRRRSHALRQGKARNGGIQTN